MAQRGRREEAVVQLVKERTLAGTKRELILELINNEFGIKMSLSSLARLKKKHGIIGHSRDVANQSVTDAITRERAGPGVNAGYRLIHQALRMRYQLPVSQHLVRDTLTVIEPARAFTGARSFPWERRLVYCPGPNYRWCIDGYDKLGKFNIFIHGCIDEYSRRVLWLRAHRTNRIPELVGLYYLEAVEKHAVVPDYINMDWGHEADKIAMFQSYFFREDSSPESHHRWVYSVRNSTIESWWKQLRKMAAQYWMNEFEALYDDGEWVGDVCDEWALLAVYLPLIQQD